MTPLSVLARLEYNHDLPVAVVERLRSICHPHLSTHVCRDANRTVEIRFRGAVIMELEQPEKMAVITLVMDNLDVVEVQNDILRGLNVAKRVIIKDSKHYLS